MPRKILTKEETNKLEVIYLKLHFAISIVADRFNNNNVIYLSDNREWELRKLASF